MVADSNDFDSLQSRRPRSFVPVPCLLRIHDRNYDCHVIDISMSGACISTQSDLFELKVGMACEVMFGVLNVRASGKIVRLQRLAVTYEVGVEFDSENTTLLNKVLYYRLKKSDAFKQGGR